MKPTPDQKLVRACRCGDLPAVRDALVQGATAWNTGLFQACEQGHVDLVKALHRDARRQQVLNWEEALARASLHNHRPVVDYILHICSQRRRDRLVQCGLQAAAQGNHMALARRMIHLGATAFIEAFENACGSGHWEMAQEMLQYGETPSPRVLEYALDSASQGGHLTVVQHLLQIRGCVATDQALFNAHLSGHVALIALLRAQGAHYNARPWVYLQAACDSGSVDAVQDVVDHFASERWDWTRALWSVAKSFFWDQRDHCDVMAYLIRRGARFPTNGLDNHHITTLLNGGVPLDWFPKRLTRRIVAFRESRLDLLAQHLPLYDALRNLVDAYTGYTPAPRGALPRRPDARRSKRLRVE